MAPAAAYSLSSDCNAISIASSKNAVLDFSLMDQAQFEALPGTREGVRVIRITGPFTLRNVMEFQAMFREVDSPVTIIDLSAVPYLDSAALGAIISVHTSAQRHQRKYALTGVADRLKVIMEMTGVANLLVMYPAITDAEEKLA